MPIDDVLDDVFSQPAEQIGVPESVVRGGMQGASFGWSEEAAAAIDAAFPDASRKVNPDVLAAAPKDADFAMRRAAALEYYRRRNKEAAGQNPKAFLAGTLGGALATGGAVAGAATRGGTLLTRTLQNAGTGAGVGALTGAGASESGVMSDPLGLLRDTAAGAAVGAGAGGAIPIAGAALSPVAARVGPWAGQKAVELGRKALSGVGTPLSARREIPEAAVRQAIDTGAIRPLGTVSGAAKRLGAQAEAVGDEYGALLQELEAAGIRGPNAILLAKQWEGRANELRRILDKGADVFTENAASLRATVPPTPFADKRLPLSQAEAIKRSLQEQASPAYVRLTGTARGRAQKEAASDVRQAVEDAIESQADLAPEAAARFAPVKRVLANTLRAREAAEEGAARAARRKAVSLTDTIVGSAGGVATGNPVAGLGIGLLHGVADRRLPSTGAVLLRALEKASQRGPKGAALSASEEAALMDFLGLRAAGAMAEEPDTR